MLTKLLTLTTTHKFPSLVKAEAVGADVAGLALSVAAHARHDALHPAHHFVVAGPPQDQPGEKDLGVAARFHLKDISSMLWFIYNMYSNLL